MSDSGLYTDQFVTVMNDYLVKMEAFEQEGESCSGLCEPGLFWFTLPVTLQPPSVACIGNYFERFFDENATDQQRSELTVKLQGSNSYSESRKWNNLSMYAFYFGLFSCIMGCFFAMLADFSRN